MVNEFAACRVLFSRSAINSLSPDLPWSFPSTLSATASRILDTKISGYSYGIAVILAFFSCVIHLATIGVLRDYLRDRGFLKHARVVIMICLIALLLQGLSESWTLEQTVTLRCAIADYIFLTDYRDIDELQEKLGDTGLVFGFTILLGLLISGYVRRILELYVDGSQNFPRSWQVALLANTIGWPASSKADILEARQRLASRLSGPTLGINGLGRIFFLVIPRNFNQSFMFEVVWLIFYFAFGISQVAFYLQGYDGDGRNTAVSFEPSFGQLLPLVLMILPFLAMAEGYSGKGPLPTSFTFAPRYMD